MRMGEHIPIERAWILITEVNALRTKEAEHLEKCRDCREFLQTFVSMARYTGFSVAFPALHIADRDDVA
jgi:hypothetical protein